MEIQQKVLEIFFPKGVFEWFDLVDGTIIDDDNIKITLQEKDISPVDEIQKIIARKFHDITITDFPIRGRRTLLTFRRRYWKIERQKEYLKRDIQLSFLGTQLEKEFADFLKDKRGAERRFFDRYSKMEPS